MWSRPVLAKKAIRPSPEHETCVPFLGQVSKGLIRYSYGIGTVCFVNRIITFLPFSLSIFLSSYSAVPDILSLILSEYRSSSGIGKVTNSTPYLPMVNPAIRLSDEHRTGESIGSG